MREIWRPVVGYEDVYEVSSFGNIRRVLRRTSAAIGRNLATWLSNKGYVLTRLCLNGKETTILVHRVVLESFEGTAPLGMQVDHKDLNKQNNRLSNLRWVTPKENCRTRRANLPIK